MESRSTPDSPGQGGSSSPTIAYSLRGSCYLNVTSRCTLRCAFCPKFNRIWVIGDANLHLPREPTVGEVLAAVGDPRRYEELVFCGLGEPTLRLYDMLEVAAELHQRGAERVRLDTDGLANLEGRGSAAGDQLLHLSHAVGHDRRLSWRVDPTHPISNLVSLCNLLSAHDRRPDFARLAAR